MVLQKGIIEKVVQRFYTDPAFREKIEQVTQALEYEKRDELDGDEVILVRLAVGLRILIEEE